MKIHKRKSIGNALDLKAASDFALFANLFWQGRLKIITHQWPTTINSSISIQISIIEDENHNKTFKEAQEAANDYSQRFMIYWNIAWSFDLSQAFCCEILVNERREKVLSSGIFFTFYYTCNMLKKNGNSRKKNSEIYLQDMYWVENKSSSSFPLKLLGKKNNIHSLVFSKLISFSFH